MVSQCSLRLEARVDAGLLANACIVSTAVRSTSKGECQDGRVTLREVASLWQSVVV